jgi:hypothetical protein
VESLGLLGVSRGLVGVGMRLVHAIRCLVVLGNKLLVHLLLRLLLSLVRGGEVRLLNLRLLHPLIIRSSVSLLVTLIHLLGSELGLNLLPLLSLDCLHVLRIVVGLLVSGRRILEYFC